MPTSHNWKTLTYSVLDQLNMRASSSAYCIFGIGPTMLYIHQNENEDDQKSIL